MWRTRWDKSSGLPRGHAESILYCHTKRSVFLKVMEDFKDIFIHQERFSVIREFVRSNVDRRLSLGIPHNWYLQLQPEEVLPELNDRFFDDVLCCEEPLMILGQCIITKGEGEEEYEHTGIFMLLGDKGRLYLYHQEDEVINMVAENADELARFGLLGCEMIYRQPSMPYATAVPDDLVQGLLARAHDPQAVNAYVSVHQERDVSLHTPGRRAKVLKLLPHFGVLHDYWPFEAVDTCRLIACHVVITLRLKCRWHLLGVIGSYRCNGVFLVSKLIILDRFGRVYVVTIRNGTFRTWSYKQSGEVYRVAGNLHEFFKAGFVKLYFRRRHEHYLRRVAQLERRPKCIHTPVITLPQRTFLQLGLGHDMEKQFRWLCREGRFKPEMLMTWDTWDAFALWQDRISNGPPMASPRPERRQSIQRYGDNNNEERSDDDDDEGEAPRRQGGRNRHADDMDEEDETDSDEDEWEDLGFDVTEDIIFEDYEDADRDLDAEVLEWWFQQKKISDDYMKEESVSEAEVEARRINTMDEPQPPEFRRVFDFREFYE
ncbi:protein US23 [Saimiriine betaherpesvirus 4]|uniref:Protein US23 n=1 Tax=Saimiriine betaherpesvirus 4 TaxID=1535247 RepID=G8XT43_9BETA|nr:protein US23 [Saimiriine betaherpesvirus 4]AEV80993.1 protein US23 [Saimiriine betaherpesvirus 4]